MDNTVATFRSHLGTAPGFPVHEECTEVEAMLQGDFQLQKGRGHGF